MTEKSDILAAAKQVIAVLRRANMKHRDADGQLLRTGWFLCDSDELAEALCTYDAAEREAAFFGDIKP